MATYIPRVFDSVLKDKLASKGAVLVEGPTWRGKTTTCEQVASSVVYLQDPRTCKQNLRLTQLDSSFFLKGEISKLIDEWREVIELRDTIRFEVDKRDEFGQFILTGSSVPPT